MFVRRNSALVHLQGAIGFTLVELLIAVAILGILASIAVPLGASYIYRSQIARAKSDIWTMEKAITSHFITKNVYPDTLDEIGYGDFHDPWGFPYRYLVLLTDKKGAVGKARKDRFLVPLNTDYDLYSVGRDGLTVSPLVAPVSRDDIIRANEGAFVGLAYLF